MAVKTIKTQVDLAGVLDCDIAQVSRYVRRKDWPFGRGPWKRSQIPAMQRWRAENLKAGAPLKPRPGESEDVHRLRLEKLQGEVRKINAQADQAETALSRERGELYDANEVEQLRVSEVVRARNEFQNLPAQIIPRALSHGLPHGASAAMQREIEEMIAAILRRMSGDGRKAA